VCTHAHAPKVRGTHFSFVVEVIPLMAKPWEVHGQDVCNIAMSGIVTMTFIDVALF